ncbi:inactive protein restricted tev movement 1, partial [Nicotiana attenuata]
MNMIKIGPVGGKKEEGTVWDEKGKSEIAKIFVSTSNNVVSSLQFVFVENGQFVLSDRHGPEYKSGFFTNFNTVVLDYPSEFLTSISGSYYKNGLRSITFGTNKGSYGPYGGDKPYSVSRYKEFKFQIGDDRSFAGFHGIKFDSWIVSIGVYVKPITST